MKFLIALIFPFSALANSILPENYQSLSATQKQNLLWSSLASEPYEQLPGFSRRLFLQALGSSALLNLKPTMTHSSDEMPKGRIKFIHTYGSCARAQFEMTQENPYTGLFQESSLAIIRLGWAAPPETVGYIPGLAIKLLVDGKPSKNLQVMNSLEGQGDNQNFFAKDFSNIISEPESALLKTLALIFKTASTNPFELTVDHLAKVDSAGNSIRQFQAPRQLVFIPTRQAQLPTRTTADLRDQLERFNPGTVLYRIYARGEHKQALSQNDALIEIGRLVLRSKFVASRYCDEKLFFQHSDTFLRK